MNNLLISSTSPKYEFYVINLKRRPDRLNNFMKNCPIPNVKVEYGFDGKNTENESLEELLLINKFKNFIPGEIGCFISHIRLYKKLIENNLDFIIIFEDDACFCKDFKNKFNNCLSQIISSNKNNSDLKKIDGIFYFGGHFEPNYKMPDNKCIYYSDHIIKQRIDYSDHHDNVRTTHAYIIFNNLAKILLDIFNNSEYIDTSLDSWICKNLIEQKCNIFNSYPLLCHSPFVSNSDIRIHPSLN